MKSEAETKIAEENKDTTKQDQVEDKQTLANKTEESRNQEREFRKSIKTMSPTKLRGGVKKTIICGHVRKQGEIRSQLK